MKRIPSLDGLRAVSILVVIASHAIVTPGFTFAPFRYFIEGFVTGDLGVNIFFVISGYIITQILRKEETASGRISLKNFYTRRILRIFPVYYFFLFVVFICYHYNFVNDLSIRSFVPALTFTTGLWPLNTGWNLGHTWSLSTEEQFYLLWPGLMILLSGLKKRNLLLVALIILIPVFRIVWYYRFGDYMYSFPGRGDCILMGCLLALNEDFLSVFIKKYPKLVRVLPAMLLLCVFTINYCAYKTMLGFITVPFCFTVHGIFAGSLILKYVVRKNKQESTGYRLLNLKWMIWIGLLSYSLYLWQQFFLQKSDYSPYWWKQFPVNLIPIFLAAAISYYCIEKPVLKFRKYFFVKS